MVVQIKFIQYVTDHLGNVRAVVTNGNVVERNNYYPFGGRHSRSTLPVLSTNRWRLGAKETQPSATGSIVDFGARMYDPSTGRWTTQDPMAWKYPGMSPYNYCGNDPINLVDPEGNIIETLWDIVNVAADIESLVSNIEQRKIGAELKLIRQSDSAADIISTGTTIKKDLHRPYIRKSTREAVETKARKDNLGRYIDPNTNMPIEGHYDLGHKPGHEFKKEKEKAISEGLTQKEFNDRLNNPDLYQIEDTKSNRSHKYEKK